MVYLRKLMMLGTLFFLSFEIGCMSDEANRCYLKEKLPPKQVSQVQVLRKAPDQPYIVIADFQANNASFEHMRERAAEVGADAVIVVPVGGYYSTDEVWASEDRYSDSYSRLIATAIKYQRK